MAKLREGLMVFKHVHTDKDGKETVTEETATKDQREELMLMMIQDWHEANLEEEDDVNKISSLSIISEAKGEKCFIVCHNKELGDTIKEFAKYACNLMNASIKAQIKAKTTEIVNDHIKH